MIESRSIQHWLFENTYTRLPGAFYSRVNPSSVSNPATVIFNEKLSNERGLQFLTEDMVLSAQYLSGNKLPEDADPIAQAYAGHQFGHFTMLGDGRAIVLGEILDKDQNRFDIQLKGAGQTPYSRRGDGKATLKAMLREYIMSEAMFYLGIPTSRSLAVVSTGEPVFREKIQKGAVLTRIMKSHIRVGTFEYGRQFCTKEEFSAFIQYVTDRHYPECSQSDQPVICLISHVMQAQIKLVVNWLRVGFIHGVMNTDNTSISGETFDYGPCAFINSYDPNAVYSSIDTYGRYAFARQPDILKWNIAVFASSLMSVVSDDRNKNMETIHALMDEFDRIFNASWYKMMLGKIGLEKSMSGDYEIIESLLKWMEDEKADYTDTFQMLEKYLVSQNDAMMPDSLKEWAENWQSRILKSYETTVQSISVMQKINPKFIPRNHMVEHVLQQAELGDMDPLHDMLDRISHPYDEMPTPHSLSDLTFIADDEYVTYCGT